MTARKGRIRLESDGVVNQMRCLAVPDDGGEPIELSLVAAVLDAEAGAANVATLVLYPGSIELEGELAVPEGESAPRVRISAGPVPGRPSIYPDVVVQIDGEALTDVRRLDWRGDLRTSERFAKVALDQR